ncbi:hypothetical protein; putative resolvase [Bradyrhizobium sp. ORS 278]|nr:hypothetical protein; putative resolvase [Bradyrhizobium sp. ORS 278]
MVQIKRKPAIGYTRTSSAANVGEGKDSVIRQRKAIQAYANKAGLQIVAWFDDPAVAGADAIDERPGFAAALEQIAGKVSERSSSRPQTGLPVISSCRKPGFVACMPTASP